MHFATAVGAPSLAFPPHTIQHPTIFRTYLMPDILFLYYVTTS